MKTPFRKGRSGSEPRHVRLYEWMLQSPAWQSLDVYERALYVEFKARYNGVNNGNIAFSGDEMAAAMNCSNRPADRALKTLLERGFVKVSQKGNFSWKVAGDGKRRATTYTLTEYSLDWPDRSAMPATKDFMRWPFEDQKKNSRGALVTPMGCSDHPVNPDAGCSRHPNGVSTSPDKAPNQLTDGVLSSPAYIYTRVGGGRRSDEGEAEPHVKGGRHAA